MNLRKDHYRPSSAHCVLFTRLFRVLAEGVAHFFCAASCAGVSHPASADTRESFDGAFFLLCAMERSPPFERVLFLSCESLRALVSKKITQLLPVDILAR